MANVVLLRAYYERPNFYSAAVYIAQSTGSLMFLVNLMLIVAAACGYGLQRLFYGPLRPIETEQLYDKAWFAVSETLLAMTIFRDDIGMWFFAMFLCLLAGKVWQWIGEGRVEFLEQQPPANPKLFHARLMSSLLLSVGFDIFMMRSCVQSILSDARPGVMVMFGFEYVLLAIASVSTLLRYTLSLVELYVTHRQEKAREEARRIAREQVQQRDTAEGTELPAGEDDDDEGDVPGWEEKGRWVFYLDLTTDFIKSVVYLGFFMILLTFYGIPIHIMRDLFMTIRSFIKRVHDFVQYRNATRDMNTRYPDATAEELERENTCIVCREDMRAWVQPGANGPQPGRRVDERQRPKKLPCGHILHSSCLRSWLERQQVCPTCRRSVLAQPVAQTTQRNDQANPGQQNQQGPNAFQALFPRNLQPGAAGQQAQPAQPAPPAGRQNQVRGNMRVFNFGPFRVAYGNLQQANANNNNLGNALEQMRQQAIAINAGQDPTQQNQNQDQNQALAQNTMQLPVSGNPPGPIPGAVALHPADVQSDILRIQHNIIESLRQLNAQHEQLEVVHRLLAELNRLQQASGAAVNGQELPPFAPLNPQTTNNFAPQAYFARGSVLRQGDAGIPEGLTLPEGWTLSPMALARRPVEDSDSVPAPLQPSQPTAEANASTSATATRSNLSTGPSSHNSEPSSLASSWNFGNERSEGSSSAIAGSSSESSDVSRRTVTVEDAEDNGS